MRWQPNKTILLRRCGTSHRPKRLKEQRARVGRLAERGQDTMLAKVLLETMQITLVQMNEHRAMIERAIAVGRK